MAENQTVWKSDNQGVKEETFIQTGRRGRDHPQQGSGLHMLRWGVVERVAPHSCADKVGGTTGERENRATQSTSVGN